MEQADMAALERNQELKQELRQELTRDPDNIALFAEVHDAVLDQVAGLLQLSGAPLRAAMADLLDDLRQDFVAEERMLAALRSGSAAGHIAEHGNLLARLAMAADAGTEVCHQALRALPGWFRHHLDSWDALLARDLGQAG
jgi:hemerythrin